MTKSTKPITHEEFMRNYNAGDLKLCWKGKPIEGFAPDTFIRIIRNGKSS